GAAQSSQAQTDEYAVALNNLALACTRQHKDEEAIPFMEQAIALKRRISGPLHPSYLGNLQDMALLLAELGRDTDAIPYFEEMRDIIREHAGETDPEFARILQNLALAFRRSGREQEAEACARRAAEILDTHGSEMEDSSGACKPADQESLGRRPYDIQVGQALALYAQGDHERARRFNEKCLPACLSCRCPPSLSEQWAIRWIHSWLISGDLTKRAMLPSSAAS